MSRLMRLAVVSSHPIQTQAPWFRALAQVVDLEVFYAHRQDAAGQAAAGFEQPFDWDVPLLDGYRYRWLDNVSPEPTVESFAGCDTPAIAPALADGNFDACIVTGWYLKTYVQAIRACWQARLPLMLRGDSHLGTTRPLLTKAAKYLPYRWLLPRVDAHLYVGEANRAYLRHYGVSDSQLFFVPHFVDNDRFSRSAASARATGAAGAFRASIGVPPGATVFLFAGKLVERKRATDFVQALAGLRASGRIVHGVIVGTGQEGAAVRDQAAMLGAPIHFAGFKNQSEMPGAYAAADCLVLPSSRESWGLVVNEAMACGLPAIVSDASGCAPDLVVPGRTGFVYSAANVPELWDRMRQVVDALEANRDAFRTDVLAHISRYDAPAAVVGTMDALGAITHGGRPRLEAEAVPVLSRGRR